MSYRAPPPHSIRSLLPVLQVMGELGCDAQLCLRGTGIMLSQLKSASDKMTFQQELAVYRNLRELSGDPLIGLKLGEPFLPQRYGFYGYALLSAPTMRQAMHFGASFGQLTFSFFRFEFIVEGSRAAFAMSEPPPIEQELVELYLDRDISAAVAAFTAVLERPFPVEEIHLTHDGHERQQDYRDYFGCEVIFGAGIGKLVFSSASLDEPLPQSDPESSEHFRAQCQMMIAKLTSQSHFVDDVRMMILARPGYVPDVEFIAEKMGMSVRTLRRRLGEEGSGYRELLDEIRYGMAKDYLTGTKLPLEEISGLLGYTEPGNFSHAFRRWSGESPRSYRQSGEIA
jgi:AraC-like DNA-binding protein